MVQILTKQEINSMKTKQLKEIKRELTKKVKKASLTDRPDLNLNLKNVDNVLKLRLPTQN